MFVYSRLLKNPVCHINDCRFMKSIKKENRVWIMQRSEIPDDMNLCKVCFAQKTEKVTAKKQFKARIEVAYRAKEMEIEKFCMENGWKIKLCFSEGYIEIYSTFDIWRICALYNPACFKLYHKNRGTHFEEDETAKFQGFHKQKTCVPFEEIMQVLSYIKEHDVFIFKNKRTMSGLIRLQKAGSCSAKYKDSKREEREIYREELSAEEEKEMRIAERKKRKFRERELKKYIDECTRDVLEGVYEIEYEGIG